MAVRALICMLLAGGRRVCRRPPPVPMAPRNAVRKHFWPHWPAATCMAVAQELHPDEVEKLRTRLIALFRAEASRSDNTYRSRLFGPGRSLSRTREHDRGALLCRAVRSRALSRARIREGRLAGRSPRRQGGVPRWQGHPAEGARGGQGPGDGGARPVRRAVARRDPERSRSAARRSHRRPRRRRAAAVGRRTRQVAGRSAGGAAVARASASCWRVPKPVSRRGTARSTTANS